MVAPANFIIFGADVDLRFRGILGKNFASFFSFILSLYCDQQVNDFLAS